MSYFISALDIVSQPTSVRVELAHPTGDHPSAINILCGLNATGKSLLLEQIGKILKGRKRWRMKTPAVTFSPRPQGQIPLLFIGKAWKAKDQAGQTNLMHSPQHTSDIPTVEGEHRRIARWFLVHQMAEVLPLIAAELTSGGPLSKEAIRLVADTFGDDQRLQLCSRNSRLVRSLEETLQGTLYFRCKRKNIEAGKLVFEVVLAFQDGTTVPYGRWSDGQRAFFYLLSALHCIRPDVVLYDEPENHQHPALLTKSLEAMKSVPGQYILATHHPHLIFSRHVDTVYYIETSRPSGYAAPPSTLTYSSRFLEAPLNRNVSRLEDTFDRMNAAYRLFDHQDDLLLRQAGYVKRRATLRVLEAIGAVFQPRVAREKTGSLPDVQTQQLSDSIGRVVAKPIEDRVQVIDLGAGVGRQVAEVDKITTWQLGARVDWTCYEPNGVYREELERRFAGRSDVQVVGDSGKLENGKYTMCLIANVLHELTPPEIGDLLAEARRLLVPNTGVVVILELYPLLRPEGFAVPYDSTTLADLLRECGLSCDVAGVPLGRTGSTAYCLFGRWDATRRGLERKVVEERVERAWDKILQRSLSAYMLGNTVRALEQHVGLLSHLTTMASICAWREKHWTGSTA